MATGRKGKTATCAAATLLAALIWVFPARAQQDPGAATAAGTSSIQSSAATQSARQSSGADGQGAPPAENSSSSTTSSTPRSTAGTAPSDEVPQGQKPHDDRIFGVMPNYLTVEGSQDVPPLTTGKKFKLTAQGAFDPYEFAIVGLLAGINQATDKDNSYGQGGAGYGKRYGAGFADQAIGNFMTGAIFPSLLREDPRYFELGHGRARHRALYALSRMVLIHKDSGGYGFNYSEWLGNASAAGVAMAYRDQQDRNVSNVAETWVEQMGVDAFGYELKEFWPSIHRWLTRGKKRQEEQQTSPGAG